MATPAQPADSGGSVAIGGDGVELEADERPPDVASNSAPVLEQAVGSGGRIEASASLGTCNKCRTCTVSFNLAAQLIGSAAGALIYHMWYKASAAGDQGPNEKKSIFSQMGLVAFICILLLLLIANRLAVRHSGGRPRHGADHDTGLLNVSVQIE